MISTIAVSHQFPIGSIITPRSALQPGSWRVDELKVTKGRLMYSLIAQEPEKHSNITDMVTRVDNAWELVKPESTKRREPPFFNAPILTGRVRVLATDSAGNMVSWGVDKQDILSQIKKIKAMASQLRVDLLIHDLYTSETWWLSKDSDDDLIPYDPRRDDQWSQDGYIVHQQYEVDGFIMGPPPKEAP